MTAGETRIARGGQWQRRGRTPIQPPAAKRVAYGHWYGVSGGGQRNDAFDDELAASIGVSTPVSTFVRGYSGSGHPSTFANSSVSAAQSRGLGAMLNVKRPWPDLANGAYDSLITDFYQSWPPSVWGAVTINHEPENDGPAPANPSNPDYVTWANANAPVYCAGVRRYIDVAAPIIRARGLNVKIGSTLMDFSWDTTRWTYWKWWEGITAANLGEVDFGIDAYVKTVNGNPPYGYDLLPRIHETVAEMRQHGIGSYSLWETAVDRRERNNGDVIVGTDQTVADWLPTYVAGLEAIPEVRMVCHFHTPEGPASAQAYLAGPAVPVWADICMNGRRP